TRSSPARPAGLFFGRGPASGVAAQAAPELRERGDAAGVAAPAPVFQARDQLLARRHGALPEGGELAAHGFQSLQGAVIGAVRTLEGVVAGEDVVAIDDHR